MLLSCNIILWAMRSNGNEWVNNPEMCFQARLLLHDDRTVQQMLLMPTLKACWTTAQFTPQLWQLVPTHIPSSHVSLPFCLRDLPSFLALPEDSSEVLRILPSTIQGQRLVDKYSIFCICHGIVLSGCSEHLQQDQVPVAYKNTQKQ